MNAAKIGVPDGVSGAEVQDSPADGGDEWPAASVLSVAAPLRANADFGSKVRGCVIAGAASGAFRDKTLVSAGRRMLYSAAIRFYACERAGRRAF